MTRKTWAYTSHILEIRRGFLTLMKNLLFYFSDFPDGCRYFIGPNPIECYVTLFLKVGCLNKGYAVPTNSSIFQGNSIYDRVTLM